MKQHGLIAVIFLIGCATGGVASRVAVSPARAAGNGTRWEYQCQELEKLSSSALSKTGADGWELVSTTAIQTSKRGYSDAVDSYAVCFKRAVL
jgi:hypothetical protein